MPKYDDIADDELRELLARAQQQMRDGKAADSVRTCSDAFLKLLAKKPELLKETTPLRRGRQMPLVMQWPRLGANLTLESVEAGKPEITFERERFATSEAITYYEFTVDTALRAGV